MKYYAAFLRGVSPMNLEMSELGRTLASAGFSEVKTLLSSGNAVFATRAAQPSVLERKAEAAMLRELGRTFFTIVRPIEELRALIESDPFAPFRLGPKVKRVVTFLREAPSPKVALPPALHEARILKVRGREVLSSYVPGPQGPVFMTLIEKTFGKDATTRTWETVGKVARATP